MPKNPHAVALGRLGAKKGGLARAAKMTPEELSASGKKASAGRMLKISETRRSEIARKGGLARWNRSEDKDQAASKDAETR